MQISYASNDSVAIKTKTETVTVGASVQINGYTVPGPGEYDVVSIQCEAKPLSMGVAYFIHAEDLTVTFLTHADSDAADLADISNSNVLILDVRSDDTADKVKALIKKIEPFYVFLIGAGATAEFITELDLTPFESSSLKVTRSGLPLEGTFMVPRA